MPNLSLFLMILVVLQATFGFFHAFYCGNSMKKLKSHNEFLLRENARLKIKNNLLIKIKKGQSGGISPK